MNPTVELGADTPESVRRALGSVQELEITTGRTCSITAGGTTKPLMILPRPRPVPPPDIEREIEELVRRVAHGGIGLVVAGAIPITEREAIERGGLSWCDGRGALHLAWPGMHLHIDRGARRPARERAAGHQGVGPASLRALQVVIGSSDEWWTVSQVAKAAALSIGQANTVLRALEQSNLLRREGKGPRQRSAITDRRAALDWLATIDRARRRPKAAATHLWARTPDDLLDRFAALAADAGLPYAFTGAAASHLMGTPVLTKVLIAHVRIGMFDAADAMHRLGLEHLDAENVARGANLELWTDTGELGTFGAGELNGVSVAPPIRIWLDIAREGGRGEDAAQIFREQVLEGP